MRGAVARPLHPILLVGVLLLAGCMVGPDYQRPPLDLPPGYR